MTYHTNGSCALKSITVEWEYFLVRKDKETLIFRKKKKKHASDSDSWIETESHLFYDWKPFVSRVVY